MDRGRKSEWSIVSDLAAELDSSEKDITVSLKVHGESFIFLTGSAHTVGTKPQRFYRDTIWQDKSGHGGVSREFFWSKNQNFSSEEL